MILVCLAFLFQVCLIINLRRLTTSSSLLLSVILEVFKFFKFAIISLTKTVSSSLFFRIDNLVEMTFFSIIEMIIVRGAWSDIRR